MFGGPEMYDLAKHLTHERVRRAEQNRLASHLRELRAETPKASFATKPPAQESWAIEWTTSGLAGGRVTVKNPVTGKSHTGRHPFDWDQALTRALHGSS